jgi:rSAM/selenodomain-associated transferase 2
MNHRYSVIIPTYNEEVWISRTLEHLRPWQPDIEVIVADGGSRDATCRLAREHGVSVVDSTRGRGYQCNSGARATSGDILLFLHADTRLPADAFAILDRIFAEPAARVGTFRLSFDERHWLLALYAACTTRDSLFTRFGDQCIVIRRDFFDELGGFPDWPLFEDVHLLRQARRRTRVLSFPGRVITSARRFRRYGLVRTQLRNAWLIFLYLRGVSPERLAVLYNRRRPEGTG